MTITHQSDKIQHSTMSNITCFCFAVFSCLSESYLNFPTQLICEYTLIRTLLTGKCQWNNQGHHNVRQGPKTSRWHGDLPVPIEALGSKCIKKVQKKKKIS